MVIAKDTLSEWNKTKRDITNIVMMGMESFITLKMLETELMFLQMMLDYQFQKKDNFIYIWIVPKIEDAGNEIGSMLAISLHATNNDLRNELVPINKKYPIEELLDACMHYPRVKTPKELHLNMSCLKALMIVKQKREI